MSESDVSPSAEQLAGALGAPRTVDEVAAALPHFTRASVEYALTVLADAGVLRRTVDAGGEARYELGDVSRYRLVGADVIQRPDSQTGRRGDDRGPRTEDRGPTTDDR